jgi:hypothetical protein
MPVMIVGVYCRNIAKPAPDRIGIGLTRAIEIIAPKTDGRDRYRPPEIAGDHVVDPRIEGLEFSSGSAGDGTSGQQREGNGDYCITLITIHF